MSSSETVHKKDSTQLDTVLFTTEIRSWQLSAFLIELG